ncbi:hypothetical protein BHE74_00003770, partial [Ensete ventricosum]
IARPYVLSKLNDYAKFQAVAIAIERSGFKVKRHFDTFCVLIISGLVISAILMTCVTRVAKTSLEKALAENNVQVDALTAAPSPVSAGATGDLLEPLVVKIDPYRQ